MVDKSRDKIRVRVNFLSSERRNLAGMLFLLSRNDNEYMFETAPYISITL